MSNPSDTGGGSPGFSLGSIVATQNALDSIPAGDILTALGRHSRCDWGDLDQDDRVANDHAVVTGDRLLSAYHSEAGVKFWVITEWDRSVTTVLLPEDY